MNRIEIYWGSDSNFEMEIKKLDSLNILVDIFNHIDETNLKIKGIESTKELPMEVENLVIHTDDYGGVKEWAILGFSNNVLKNQKVNISNLWLCNPPRKIYEDIKRNFDKKIINEHEPQYVSTSIDIEDMKNMARGYSNAVIGQPNVMKQTLSSIYALQKPNRNRPVTLLFLGDSGVGKTETAKYISNCLKEDMVRIQFSMQQTSNAYQYIFGGEHGEDCLARELIRRSSNIILLDEFDKVPPAFYNAFYQMFDEGTFEDANYSVDVTKCIIICTTNYRSHEEASKNLGSPIYSRFSKVIVFNQISIPDKLTIAEKCYKNLMNNITPEDKSLIKDNNVMMCFENAIRNGAYSNMRILKNDIEDAINFKILQARGIID